MKKIILALFSFLFIPFSINALDLDISSENLIMLNLTTNEIIYEKNKDEIKSIASLQKIMTTLIAIENINDYNEKIIINTNEFSDLDDDLAVIGFKDNEIVTYDDLLYATILKSGADAAYKLALQVSGSEEKFVELMNKKVKDLGLKNTNFKNCIGLDEDDQYSTAYDISIILKYALNNLKFKEIFLKSKYITSDEKFSFIGPIHKAKSLDMDYLKGGKTGYTKKAGLCLASYSVINDIEFILVTLGADYNLKNQNYIDQKIIYDYFKDNYSYRTILKKGDYIYSINTKYGKTINYYSEKDIKSYISNNINLDEIYIKYKGKDNINKEVKKNDIIGNYYIMYKNTVLYTDKIYLKEDINYNYRKFILILPVIFIIIFIKKYHFRKSY